MSEREDGCFVPPIPHPLKSLKRPPRAGYSLPYQTRLRPYHRDAIKAVLAEEVKRDPEITEARVLRGIIRLGVVRYRELGRLPEVD
jgi:hypothetical protein